MFSSPLVASAGAASAEEDAEPAVDRIIKFLLWSAMATDRYQSHQWVHTTPENPARIVMRGLGGSLETGAPPYVCACIYESNRWIAGQPQALEPYFEWWAQAAEVFPYDRKAPWMRLIAAVTLADWVRTVIKNNRHTRLAEQVLDDPDGRWSEYLVFEYRLVF